MTRKRAHTKKPIDNTAVPATFGEQVAADHLVADRLVCRGINRSAYAVVFWGIGARYVDSYPRRDNKGHRGPTLPYKSLSAHANQ